MHLKAFSVKRRCQPMEEHHLRKLLDQVHACLELVETTVIPTSSTGEAWPSAALGFTDYQELT